ncbi:MAG: DUF3810 family protein [Verrucomicrobiota bacterium]|jgi:hypothetical protein
MKLSNPHRIRISIVLAAIALAAIRFPARWVEDLYSTGLYPPLAAGVKSLTRWLPVPVLDLLLVTVAIGLPAGWIWKIRAAETGRKWRAAGRAVLDTLTLAAALVCAFELLWGLNYQRLPLTSKLDWDSQRVTSQAVLAFARSNLENLNAEAVAAHAQPMPEPEQWRAALERSFQQVVRELGHRRDFTGVAPRTSLVNPFLDAASVDGFINPLGYEVILDSHVLPFEQPFLLAHEWSHLAGFADESEANFIGILACLRGDLPALRYSGRLYLSFYLPRRNTNAADPWPELSPQVLTDISAIRARAQKHNIPAVSNFQERFYNGFLKANRIPSGILSYGLVTRLIVGTRFEPNWIPVLRRP